MAEAKSPTIKGLTRGKAILIGVLSVVLVVILYVQFGGTGKPAGDAAGYRPPRAAVVLHSNNSAANTVTPASATLPVNAPGTKGKDTTTTLLIDQARWKSPKLETIVAYDPFALPACFPQPSKVAVGKQGRNREALIAAAAADQAKKLADAREKLHMQLIELRQRGVHVILRDGDQYAAVIGDRMLHVGDKINDFTVTAIDPDGGVDIERKESP